jgi:hypothetical protein
MAIVCGCCRCIPDISLDEPEFSTFGGRLRRRLTPMSAIFRPGASARSAEVQFHPALKEATAMMRLARRPAVRWLPGRWLSRPAMIGAVLLARSVRGHEAGIFLATRDVLL